MDMFKPWVSPAGAVATVLAYGLYVLLSPVQEFVARGLMQGALTRMLTGRWVPLQAILVSNAVFSISHQHLGLGYALAVFVPGLFWGWLYHRHGSLLGVCVSHAIIGLWGAGMLDLASLVG
ncbi:CPBP intramembrane metalloprotease [compost metagenome]